MTKYYKEPGYCPVCNHKLGIHKHKEKYIYYVCHPCRHKEYPGKETTIRSYHLKKKGVTIEWYEEKLKEQGGVCAICKNPPSEVRSGKIKNLNIDHDHNHCKGGCPECVRGLLCSNCNRALGKFYDKIDLLENAIKYLQEVEDLPDSTNI